LDAIEWPSAQANAARFRARGSRWQVARIAAIFTLDATPHAAIRTGHLRYDVWGAAPLKSGEICISPLLLQRHGLPVRARPGARTGPQSSSSRKP